MRQSLTAKTIIVMFVIGGSKIVGFIRTAVLAAVFGATWQTDSFYMAQNIIGILIGASSSGLTSSIVPIRTQIIHDQGKKEADRFASSLINIILLITVLLTLLSFFIAPQLVSLFAPKFVDAQYMMTIHMVKLLTALIIISALIAMLSGVLNAHHIYLPAQMIGFPLSIITITIAIIWGRAWGIYAMLAGFIIGTFSQVFVILPAAKKVFKYSPILKKSSALKDTLIMSIPIFISTYANIINQAVDKALASGLQTGSISAITYANQLVGLVSGIIIVPIITTLFTSFSELAAGGEYEEMKRVLVKIGSVLLIILVPITVICLLLAKPIVSIVYQRGTFDEAAVNLTKASFFFLVLSLLALGHQLSLSRCFFALKDSRIPLIATVVGVIVNVVLNLLLVKPMQISGLALATSVSYFVMCGIMLIMLRQKIGSLGIITWLKDSIKVFIGCIVMAPAVWLVFNSLNELAIFKFVIACCIGAIVYIVILWGLKQREIREVTDKVKAIITRGF